MELIMFQHSGALVERVKAALALLRNDHQGVTALEYGLLAGLIAVAIIGAATGLGTAISNAFTAIAAHLGVVT
jgi:pilus assembly protein Flp/PilA